MNNGSGWNIPSRPAPSLGIETKITIIKISEIIFIEKSNIPQYFTTNHHACTGNPVGLKDLIPNWWRYDPSTEKPSHETKPDIIFKLARRRLEPKRRSVG